MLFLHFEVAGLPRLPFKPKHHLAPPYLYFVSRDIYLVTKDTLHHVCNKRSLIGTGSLWPTLYIVSLKLEVDM